MTSCHAAGACRLEDVPELVDSNSGNNATTIEERIKSNASTSRISDTISKEDGSKTNPETINDVAGLFQYLAVGSPSSKQNYASQLVPEAWRIRHESWCACDYCQEDPARSPTNASIHPGDIPGSGRVAAAKRLTDNVNTASDEVAAKNKGLMIPQCQRKKCLGSVHHLIPYCRKDGLWNDQCTSPACIPGSDAFFHPGKSVASRRIVRAKRPPNMNPLLNYGAIVAKNKVEDTNPITGKVDELCKIFQKEVIQLKTLYQRIKYWSQHECRVMLNTPTMAGYLFGWLFSTAATSLLLDTDDGFVLGTRACLNAFFVAQCCDKLTQIDKIIRTYNSSGTIEDFLSWMPALRHGDDTTSKQSMARSIDICLRQKTSSLLEGCKQSQFSISFATTGSPNDTAEYTIDASSLLKWIVRAYSKDKNIPLKSLCFAYGGRNLFLSSAGKKTAKELGLKSGSVIMASRTQHPPGTTELARTTAVSDKVKPVSSNMTRKGTGKKKPQNNSYLVLSEEERFKQRHSKAISFVFEECAARFKSTRGRLNAMNLKRMQLKPKSKRLKSNADHLPIANPPSHDTGKPGNWHIFFVQVGEVSNLYMTSKPSANRHHAAWRKTTTIDLHGLTKSNALSELDASLPKLVGPAMKGRHPWIVPVKIICGGGNQILAEAIKGWIKRNTQVANAPKSICSS